MYQDFIATRIAQLRDEKGISAREMSLSIGQADNYVNHIENRKSLPSITSFFYICEYLNVTPMEFFDIHNKNPEELNSLISDLKKLDKSTLSHISGIVKKIIDR